MTMYADLFAGNLRGVMEQLPYLKELGVTYLHLMPLLKMPHPQSDGGYAVEDFDAVDPALGTNEELIALTRALRASGISLCLDFVMNHTADTHEWAMRAKAGDTQAQAYYFCYPDRAIPDRCLPAKVVLCAGASDSNIPGRHVELSEQSHGMENKKGLHFNAETVILRKPLYKASEE